MLRETIFRKKSKGIKVTVAAMAAMPAMPVVVMVVLAGGSSGGGGTRDGSDGSSGEKNIDFPCQKEPVFMKIEEALLMAL